MARTSLRSRRRLCYGCLLGGSRPCRQALLFCPKNLEWKQRRSAMSLTIIKGTIVSAPALGQLDITPGGYLVAEDGVIQGVYETLPERYAGAPAEDYGDALILQSFADLHLHGAQYPMLGMGMDLPLL